MRADPAELFQGTIAVAVPHMDDCVLACGGMMARMPDNRRLHVIYATDGRRSPAPAFPTRRFATEELVAVRKAEAVAAMGYLGVPAKNVYFLDFPDGELGTYRAALQRSITGILDQIAPRHIFAPFRYDRHPDHLALNRAVTSSVEQGGCDARLLEYFVYYRWRLLRRGDVREYLDRRCLIEVGIGDVAARKRAALSHFKSQTTRYYPWQACPVLSAKLLDEVCQAPELFLEYDPARPGKGVFTGATTWIRIVHRLEPLLKQRKDQVVAMLHRGARDDA